MTANGPAPMPPGLAAPAGYDPLAGAGAVGLDARTPPPPLGDHVAEIVSIRSHNGIAGPGILIDVTTGPAATPGGWRIQLGGKFPAYGIRDAKFLLAACEGWAKDDPRAVWADAPELRAMMADPTPYKGRKIRILVTEDTRPDKTTGQVKIDKATGRPYVRVQPFPLDGAAPLVASPAAPPPAPPAASGPPAGWYAFPPGDPRHGTHYYRADGAIAQIGVAS